jgi:2-phosphosulfolactate phosphatase
MARIKLAVVSLDRVPRFHAAVDERFAFLLNQGFRVADRGTYAARFGHVKFERESAQVYLSWDAFAGGELQAKLNCNNLWPTVIAEGLWHGGREPSVYMGYAIDAMEHGLDLIASLLNAHPELLWAVDDSEHSSLYRQADYGVRFERGEAGLRAVARGAAVIVIVDVLSFSTAVDVAVSREALVRPARSGDDGAAQIAAACDALLAVPRHERSARNPYSLSPPTLETLPKGARLVLPSPNGATLILAAATEQRARVVVGCLRNASSIAAFARPHAAYGAVAVISAGERWSDGTLRPALEDDLAAGAIIAGIRSSKASPEARFVAEGFLEFRAEIGQVIAQTVSGRELIEDGYAEDVRYASAVDESSSVPLLGEDGFIRWVR